MKCIKKGDEIRRVSDVDVDIKVKVHGWTFAPKSEWKTKVRDANKKTVEVDVNAEVVVDKKLAKRLKLKEKQDGTRLR
jgi:LEA14-like dessication related protein